MILTLPHEVSVVEMMVKAGKRSKLMSDVAKNVNVYCNTTDVGKDK